MIEKEVMTSILGIGSVNTALEIMCDEGNIICSLAREAEAVDTDPEKAYFEYASVNRKKSYEHIVFCGNPVTFLRKKIAEEKKVDMIVVNTDRLEKSCDIWKMISILAPSIVVLGYREQEKGEYNRRLMRTSGFRIMKQEVELNRQMSEKFCVGVQQ